MSVYFATAGDYVKIGYSADPVKRMGTVTRTGMRPDDLPAGAEAELIGWVSGGRSVEAALHRKFAELHAAGEWYRGIKLADLRQLIDADPRGIDVHRMSAIAAFVALAHPELTRDQIASLGVRVKAVSAQEAVNDLGQKAGAA